MKLLVVIALFIGCVVAPPSKEELQARAAQLEARLESDLQKMRGRAGVTPQEIAALEAEDRTLKTLSAELNQNLPQNRLTAIENELNQLENRVNEQLAAIERRLGLDTTTHSTQTTPPPTTPTPPPTTPTPAQTTTGAPTQGPTTQGPTGGPNTDDLKQELLDRAARLQERVKAEIQKLVDEKREHLSTLLKEEGDRVDKLVADLKAATDAIQLIVLESELIDAEYRVSNEVTVLERETATQELLLKSAALLKQQVTDEITKLEAVTGDLRARAQEAISALKREESELELILQRLVGATNQREIETLEVEIRAAEIRIIQTIRGIDNFLEGTTQTPN